MVPFIVDSGIDVDFVNAYCGKQRRRYTRTPSPLSHRIKRTIFTLHCKSCVYFTFSIEKQNNKQKQNKKEVGFASQINIIASQPQICKTAGIHSRHMYVQLDVCPLRCNLYSTTGIIALQVNGFSFSRYREYCICFRIK